MPAVAKGAARKGANGRAVTGGAAATTPVAKKRTSEVTQSAADPACGGCGRLVTDGVRALQCDHCQSASSWRCAECINLSHEVYDALVNDGGVNLKWFCENCERDIGCSRVGAVQENQKLDRMLDLFQKFMDAYEHIDARFDEKTDAVHTAQLETRIRSLEERFLRLEAQLETKVQSLEERFVRMEERLGKVDERVNGIEDGMRTEARQPQEGVRKEEGNGGMRAVMEEAVDRQLKEDKEIERRCNNIVLYRLEESGSTDNAERSTHDKEQLESLCREVFDLRFDEGDVVKMFRLGQKAEGRIRPLLVTLKTPEVKSKIMTNLRNLKVAGDRYKAVGISNDLTPKQRESAKQMMQQAKMEQDATGESSENFKFFVVGHFTHPRVIRVRK